MGLLAVMGPSMKDQRGLSLFSCMRFWKAFVFCQNCRILCSSFGKSTVVVTGLNMVHPPE